MGKPITPLLAPGVRHRQRHVSIALAGQQVTYEYSMDLRDGRTVYARSTLVPEIDANGVTLELFCSLVRHHRTAPHPGRAGAGTQKWNHRQLTGGLAHDFNNMLTVVAGNLQALRQQLGERSKWVITSTQPCRRRNAASS